MRRPLEGGDDVGCGCGPIGIATDDETADGQEIRYQVDRAV